MFTTTGDLSVLIVFVFSFDAGHDKWQLTQKASLLRKINTLAINRKLRTSAPDKPSDSFTN